MSIQTPVDKTPPEETIVPDWISVSAHYFRWGLALFLLISAVLGMAGCSVQVFGTPWQAYSPVLEESEVVQILTDNTLLTPAQVTAEHIEAVKVFPLDGLFLVNLNDPDQFCGHSDCLYLGYRRAADESLKEVFNAYLNPNIPPDYSLFEPLDRTANGLPCFLINQVNGTDIDRYTLCFDGSEYQVEDVKAFPSGESA